MKKTIQGFTLIELVIVIILVSILAAVGVPKLSENEEMSLYIQAQQMLSDIRLAQGLSMTSGMRYRFVRLSTTSYQILNQSGTAITLANASTTMNLSSKVTFTTNLPNNLLAFDRAGTPYTDTAIPGTALATTGVITLTLNGKTRVINISQGTGYGVIQ